MAEKSKGRKSNKQKNNRQKIERQKLLLLLFYILKASQTRWKWPNVMNVDQTVKQNEV